MLIRGVLAALLVLGALPVSSFREIAATSAVTSRDAPSTRPRAFDDDAIVAFLWHDSPNDRKALAGVRRGLEALGRLDDLRVVNVDRDEDRARERLLACERDGVDLLLSFGTTATRLARRHVRRVPVVFTAVTNPVLANIVPSWKGSGSNVAGNSNWLDRRGMLRAFRQAVPGLRRLLVLTSAGNAVSDAEVREASDVAKETGLSIVRRTVKKDADPVAEVEAGLANAEALWIPIDFSLYQEEPLSRIVAAARRLGKPVVSSAERCAGEGALVVVTVDYETLGLRACSLVKKVLAGTPPGSLAVGRSRSSRVYIDLDAARRLGRELPLDLVLGAYRIFGRARASGFVTSRNDAVPMPPRRFSLGARFFASLVVLFVAGLLAYGFFVARRAREELRQDSDQLFAQTRTEFGRHLEELDETRSDLLARAVKRLSENVANDLGDVPFDVFEGREDLLVAYLEERLENARKRGADNAEVIAEVLRERTAAKWRERLRELEEENRVKSRALGRQLFRDLIVWGGIFLLGLSACVGLVFYFTVLEPLRRATEAIEEFRAGDRSRRIESDGAEEIMRLGRSFNSMADVIERSQRELESRVEEKTSELRQALDDQRQANTALENTMQDLERTQGRLVESAKMAAIGTLAGGMAHEFNNILGGIRGCAEDLMEDTADAESRDVLGVIVRTSKRASVITENLLRFSRREERSMQAGDIAEVVREAVALVEPEASRAGVVVRIETDAPSPAVTDLRGLQQVFLNLLVNAVHASFDAGEVRVATTTIGENYVVEVADDGVGIAADVLPRLFEPFFTTKSASTARPGTGLGLSVSEGIVAGLGGTLTAASDGSGKGATFRVVIPRRVDPSETTS